MQPQAVLAAELGELRERVDGAGARGAGVRDDAERPPSGGLVRGDRPGERLGLQPEIGADGQHAQLIRPEAERPRGAADRGMGLVGGVDHEVVAHRADHVLAGAGERREVRRGAAGDERAGGGVRIAHPVLEPAEELELELGRARRLLPRAAVDVARARDEVAERARPGPGERHVREEARVRRPAREREHVAEERRPARPRTGCRRRVRRPRAARPGRRGSRAAAAVPTCRSASRRARRPCDSRARASPPGRGRAGRNPDARRCP